MDALDIAVMSYIIYRLYKFLRGSRGVQMLVGLGIILIATGITPLFQMKGMSWVFENLRTIWLIAFVILFQPEIRRLLIYIGQSRLVRFFVKVSGSKVIDQVVEAAFALCDIGYGALIVMARETGLRTIIESGTLLQAEVSSALIVSLFNPRSPLHDGAIVIQGDLIEAAKCLLPINEENFGHIEFGTRHKAALTLSEETDAMIIVVSEERGKISIAIGGKLQRDLTEEQVKQILTEGYRYGDTDIKENGVK
ncbi:diadenylate cyclase CdaA [candidate division KSB1 bacterium]|nr:diadenylate cyclase CdaA [candidate division KSB1 bacterium]RQW08975.1 MAG: TIGR00159 family protein [candidate division KSB1 bacterium]